MTLVINLSRRLTAALLLAAVLVLPRAVFAVDAADAGEAGDVVERLHTTLIDVSREGEKLGFRGRFSRLEPVVTGSFDLPFIARVALGRYWDGLGERERAIYVERFTRLSVATWAHRFDDYGGEVFSPPAAEPARRNRVAVASELATPGGERYDFVYLLHEREGRWRIINVVVDGVSDLSLKRSQFTSIMDDDGFSTLIERIDEKIDGYSTGER